jgi:hypothetical protein
MLHTRSGNQAPHVLDVIDRLYQQRMSCARIPGPLFEVTHA